MSLGPEREPITRPVFVWLEVADLLAYHGNGDLVSAIQPAMNGRRVGDNATFVFTVGEQAGVSAVLRHRLGILQQLGLVPMLDQSDR